MMNRSALSFGLILIASSPIDAQAALPENTIKCADFRKVDAKTWATTRAAYFDIGGLKGNGLPAHLTLQKGVFELEGADLVEVLEDRCARGQPRL